MNGKWSKQYLKDLAERVASSVLGGVLTMLVADPVTGAVSGSAQQWWLVCGLPGVVSLVKGLLANLGGGAPTASLVDVTSNGEPG